MPRARIITCAAAFATLCVGAPAVAEPARVCVHVDEVERWDRTAWIAPHPVDPARLLAVSDAIAQAEDDGIAAELSVLRSVAYSAGSRFAEQEAWDVDPTLWVTFMRHHPAAPPPSAFDGEAWVENPEPLVIEARAGSARARLEAVREGDSFVVPLARAPGLMEAVLRGRALQLTLKTPKGDKKLTLATRGAMSAHGDVDIVLARLDADRREGDCAPADDPIAAIEAPRPPKGR